MQLTINLEANFACYDYTDVYTYLKEARVVVHEFQPSILLINLNKYLETLNEEVIEISELDKLMWSYLPEYMNCVIYFRD